MLASHATCHKVAVAFEGDPSPVPGISGKGNAECELTRTLTPAERSPRDEVPDGDVFSNRTCARETPFDYHLLKGATASTPRRSTSSLTWWWSVVKISQGIADTEQCLEHHPSRTRVPKLSRTEGSLIETSMPRIGHASHDSPPIEREKDGSGLSPRYRAATSDCISDAEGIEHGQAAGPYAGLCTSFHLNDLHVAHRRCRQGRSR